MTPASATQERCGQTTDKTAIRPFQVNIPEAALTDLGTAHGTRRVCLFQRQSVSIPVAVSVFPDELYPAPRSWAERAFPKLIHYNRLDKGGHFAAWEQPKFLSDEIRAGFTSLRK